LTCRLARFVPGTLCNIIHRTWHIYLYCCRATGGCAPSGPPRIGGGPPRRHRGGDTDLGRKLAATDWVDRGCLFGEHAYRRAAISALLGERDEAVELLRETFVRGHHYSKRLHREMDLEPLRDYPPYQELVRPKG
jgi:hypothetical protein